MPQQARRVEQMNFGQSLQQTVTPLDLLQSKFNVSLAGVGLSTGKDMDMHLTKKMPVQQEIEEDDAYDPLNEYYQMMKVKLNEQKRQLQQQLSKYEKNEFNEFDQVFKEKDAEETPMENQDDQLGEVEPKITHKTEEDLPAKLNKGFAIDITSMDEEGTLKLRKLKSSKR